MMMRLKMDYNLFDNYRYSVAYIKSSKQGRYTNDKTLTRYSGEGLLRGGYLLSHLRSTIGVIGLNFSVRNGKRWNPGAITT